MCLKKKINIISTKFISTKLFELYSKKALLINNLGYLLKLQFFIFIYNIQSKTNNHVNKKN